MNRPLLNRALFDVDQVIHYDERLAKVDTDVLIFIGLFLTEKSKTKKLRVDGEYEGGGGI